MPTLAHRWGGHEAPRESLRMSGAGKRPSGNPKLRPPRGSLVRSERGGRIADGRACRWLAAVVCTTEEWPL